MTEPEKCKIHVFSPIVGLCPVCRRAVCHQCMEMGENGVCGVCIHGPGIVKRIRKKAIALEDSRRGGDKAIPSPNRFRMAMAPEQARKLKKVAVPVLLVLFVLVLGSSLVGRGFIRLSGPEVARQDEGALKNLFSAYSAVESYRAKKQRLPATLAEAGFEGDRRWVYLPVDAARYMISFTGSDGKSASFDSRQDPRKVFATLMAPANK